MFKSIRSFLTAKNRGGGVKEKNENRKKDFKSDIIANYHDTIGFFYRNLRLKYEIKGFGPRKEILEIPEEALKEALVNAICHRDYTERGAVIQVDIFDDRVELSNPGGLLFKEQEFGKRSISRNPLIFGLMQRLELVEHVGSGINRIREAMAKVELNAPIFEFGTFFAVTLFRPKLGDKLGDKLGENPRKIVELMIKDKTISISEIARFLGISTTAVENNIAKLKEKKLIQRIGPDKGGHWEITFK